MSLGKRDLFIFAYSFTSSEKLLVNSLFIDKYSNSLRSILFENISKKADLIPLTAVAVMISVLELLFSFMRYLSKSSSLVNFSSLSLFEKSATNFETGELS